MTTVASWNWKMFANILHISYFIIRWFILLIQSAFEEAVLLELKEVAVPRVILNICSTKRFNSFITDFPNKTKLLLAIVKWFHQLCFTEFYDLTHGSMIGHQHLMCDPSLSSLDHKPQCGSLFQEEWWGWWTFKVRWWLPRIINTWSSFATWIIFKQLFLVCFISDTLDLQSVLKLDFS